MTICNQSELAEISSSTVTSGQSQSANIQSKHTISITVADFKTHPNWSRRRFWFWWRDRFRSDYCSQFCQHWLHLMLLCELLVTLLVTLLLNLLLNLLLTLLCLLLNLLLLITYQLSLSSKSQQCISSCSILFTGGRT